MVPDILFIEALHKEAAELESRTGNSLPTSVDLPLSAASVRVLKQARDEAAMLRSQEIDVGHLLLGLLQESTTSAVLLRNGVTREQVIERLGAV